MADEFATAVERYRNLDELHPGPRQWLGAGVRAREEAVLP